MTITDSYSTVRKKKNNNKLRPNEESRGGRVEHMFKIYEKTKRLTSLYFCPAERVNQVAL